MEYIIQAGQLLLGISILIALHEFGHYIAARAFKTRVESFYLFFNPWFSIYKKKIGETEYGIGWLPLGGYVKIAGMIDESMDKEQLAKEPQPWEFRSKPTWQRLIIMLGGVIVNIIVAFLIYAMVLFNWGEKYIPVSNASYGIHCDSLLLDMGFQHNDKVVALDGKPIDGNTTYDKIRIQLLLDGIREVTVNRANVEANIAIPEDFAQTVLRVGAKELFTEEIPFVVDSVLPNNPAEKAGFLKGDEVIAIDDIPLSGAVHSIQLMKNKENKEVVFKVLRNHQKYDITVTADDKGLIGVTRQVTVRLFNR